MKRKLVYMFVNAYANEETIGIVETETVQMITVAVKNYDEACEKSKKLADDGAAMIELCSGFGWEGVAKVKQAVQGKCIVGVVRFDLHPAFDHESGDTRF